MTSIFHPFKARRRRTGKTSRINTMENYNNELHEIFTNILRGGVYGRTARGPRWAYFSEALYIVNSAGGPFIGWHNYGSSANACDLKNLLWIIENIFKTTPRDFLKEYECRF